MIWEIVKDHRSEEAYKIMRWFYSVDWMKFQVSTDYLCEKPYFEKSDIQRKNDETVMNENSALALA